MRKIPRLLCILSALWLCVAGALAGVGATPRTEPPQAQEVNDPAWAKLQSLYDYPAAVPLHVEKLATDGNSYYTTERLRFDGVDGERIPALFCRPNIPGKVPVIIVLHGLGCNKEMFAEPIAMLAAPRGIAVMAIDARLHGERAVKGVDLWSTDLLRTRRETVNSIIDNRRALDYLDSRDDVNHDRYMLIGASMGGIMGAVLGAVEPRIKSAALLVAGGDLDQILATSSLPSIVRLRESGVDLAAVHTILHDFDPVNFIGHFAPRPLLMVNGRGDTVIPPPNAELLHHAAKDPKQIVWYEGGHTSPPLPLFGVLIDFVGNNL